MRVDPVEPPRMFEVGKRGARLAHVGDAWLEPDEVITFKTPSGTELDLTRKSWGYYGSPSLNGRVREHGLRAALAMGVPRDDDDAPRMYLMLVEAGGEGDFEDYMRAEGMRVIAWLDSDAAVRDAAHKLDSERGPSK
jgi:hypothetical protein